MRITGFGKRVIGEESALKERAAREAGTLVFGPRVIGQDAFEKKLAELQGKKQGKDDDRDELDKVLAGKLGDVLEWIAAATVPRHLELLIERERAGKTRKTVIAAAEARAAELRKANEEAERQLAADASAVAPASVATADANGNDYVSVEELAAALEVNPAILDRAIEAELARVPKPRKSAVLLLLEHEQARESGPRPDVLARLEAAL